MTRFGIGSDPFADGRKHTHQHKPDSEEYCEPSHYRRPARRHRAEPARGLVGPATAIARTQEPHDTACTLQFPELGEDEEQTRLHFFIRIENDHAASIMSKSGRQRQSQFASCRFLPLPLMKAHSDLMKLRLAHDAG
jgi:hypothetical protein